METSVEFPTADGTATGSARLVAATDGAGLGVIVVPDAASPEGHVRDVCGRLVEEAFTALAPDVERERELGATAAAIAGAVDLLCAHESVRGTGVGVVGFADGAAVALWLAALRADQVRAVVPFYGLPPPGDEPDWHRVEASVEGHFAENDDRIPPGAVEALAARLSDLGHEARMFTYPGTATGFFDDTRADLYDADAAWQAWVRTLEFLRAKLG